MSSRSRRENRRRSAPRYIESLELIRTLDFDLIVPGIAAVGQPFYTFVEKVEAERRIDGILGRLRLGESG